MRQRNPEQPNPLEQPDHSAEDEELAFVPEDHILYSTFREVAELLDFPTQTVPFHNLDKLFDDYNLQNSDHGESAIGNLKNISFLDFSYGALRSNDHLSILVEKSVGKGEIEGIVVTAKQANILSKIFGKRPPEKNTEMQVFAQVNVTNTKGEIIEQISVPIVEHPNLPLSQGIVGITEALNQRVGRNSIEIVSLVSSTAEMDFDRFLKTGSEPAPTDNPPAELNF